MTDLKSRVRGLRRPPLLVRAARIGAQDYNRARDLRRITGYQSEPSPVTAVLRLVETESECEDKRRAGDASYSIARHVEVLIALMAEARALP